MTSHYISAISNVNSRTLGPLNSHKAPNTIRVSNSIISLHQEPLSANMNTISRLQYKRIQQDTNVKQVYKDTSSSDRLRRLKSQSIGKNIKSIHTKNINTNDSRSAVRRMRSSGYVAPQRKI
jgi:hypothetical protein